MAVTFTKRKPQPVASEEDLAAGASMYTWPDPAKPAAALVPQVVRDHRALMRARRIVRNLLTGTVAAAVLASGGSVIWAGIATRDAAAAQRDAAAVHAQVAKAAPVANYVTGLQASTDALRTKLAGDITFSTLAKTTLAPRPDGVTMTALEVVPGAPCPGPDPFHQIQAIGCLQISGVATTAAAVGSYVDALNRLPASSGLEGAFAGSLSSANGTGLNFSISVDYTTAVLSGRFAAPDTSPNTPAATGGSTDASTGVTSPDPQGVTP